MIIDRLENAHFYRALGKPFREAFDFLASADPDNLEAGRHEIDRDRVFALVQDYFTRPRDLEKWEAHRLHADIQYILSGRELVGWSPVGRLRVGVPWSPAGDCLSLAGDGVFHEARKGDFLVFFPPDAHLPGVSAGTRPETVRKIVVKILLAKPKGT